MAESVSCHGNQTHFFSITHSCLLIYVPDALELYSKSKGKDKICEKEKTQERITDLNVQCCGNATLDPRLCAAQT